MTQNIITLIIVYSTAAWAVYSIIMTLKNKKASKCSGCSGGCELKDYKTNARKLSLLEIKPNKNDNLRGTSKHLHVA